MAGSAGKTLVARLRQQISCIVAELARQAVVDEKDATTLRACGHTQGRASEHLARIGEDWRESVYGAREHTVPDGEVCRLHVTVDVPVPHCVSVGE